MDIKKKILFLDDTEDRHQAFLKLVDGYEVEVWQVYNVAQAINRLQDYKFDIVFLDHDLEDKHYTVDGQNNPLVHENTGRDVVTHILTMEQDKLPNYIVIHSWNPEGSREMGNMMKDLRVEGHIYKCKFGYQIDSQFGSLVKDIIMEKV